MQVALRYDTRDPYAIIAAFRTGRAGWVEWVFSRDLLADGLIADAGDGDVRIRPGTGDPEIVLPGNETLWMNVDDALDQMIANDMP